MPQSDIALIPVVRKRTLKEPKRVLLNLSLEMPIQLTEMRYNQLDLKHFQQEEQGYV